MCYFSKIENNFWGLIIKIKKIYIFDGHPITQNVLNAAKCSGPVKKFVIVLANSI